jgi:hypothetical protein
MLRMEDKCEDCSGCNAAFYHIGGGRGTRPNKKKDIKDSDDSWIFYGTSSYARMKKISQQQQQQQLPSQATYHGGQQDWNSAMQDQQEYQQKVASMNAEVFKAEKAQRELMLQQAHTIRNNPLDLIRQHAPALASLSDEEILKMADELEERANRYIYSIYVCVFICSKSLQSFVLFFNKKDLTKTTCFLLSCYFLLSFFFLSTFFVDTHTHTHTSLPLLLSSHLTHTIIVLIHCLDSGTVWATPYTNNQPISNNLPISSNNLPTNSNPISSSSPLLMN